MQRKARLATDQLAGFRWPLGRRHGLERQRLAARIGAEGEAIGHRGADNGVHGVVLVRQEVNVFMLGIANQVASLPNPMSYQSFRHSRILLLAGME